MADKNPVDNVTERIADVFIETRALYIDSLGAGTRLLNALTRAEELLNIRTDGPEKHTFLLQEIASARENFLRLKTEQFDDVFMQSIGRAAHPQTK